MKTLFVASFITGGTISFFAALAARKREQEVFDRKMRATDDWLKNRPRIL